MADRPTLERPADLSVDEPDDQPAARARRPQGPSPATELALVCLPLAAAALLLLLCERPTGRFWPAFYDILHVVISAMLGLLALRFARRLLSTVAGSSAFHYLVAAAATATVGGGFELAQLIGAGDARLDDFIRDLLGGIAALLWMSSLASVADTASHRRRVVWRWIARALALGTLALAMLPTARFVVPLVNRYQAFPVLMDFEHDWLVGYISVDGGASLSMDAPPPEFKSARGNAVGHVTFGVGEYPGLELPDLVGDWSDYQLLEVHVYSPQAHPVELHLRVHDRAHTDEYGDRFNTVLTIAPGENRVSIPIDRIHVAPRGRQMDLEYIKALAVFMVRPNHAVTLFFDDFRLLGVRDEKR